MQSRCLDRARPLVCRWMPFEHQGQYYQAKRNSKRQVSYGKVYASPASCPGCHAGLGICIAVPTNFLSTQRPIQGLERWNAFVYIHLHLESSMYFLNWERKVWKLLEMIQPAPVRFRLGWTSRTKRVEESAPQNAPAAKHRTLIGSMASSLRIALILSKAITLPYSCDTRRVEC